MRFINVKSDDFSRVVTPGETRALLRSIPIPKQDTMPSAIEFNYTGNISMEGIAVAVYGIKRDSDWFQIANRNVREIVGWKLDMERVGKIQIPPADTY